MKYLSTYKIFEMLAISEVNDTLIPLSDKEFTIEAKFNNHQYRINMNSEIEISRLNLQRASQGSTELYKANSFFMIFYDYNTSKTIDRDEDGNRIIKSAFNISDVIEDLEFIISFLNDNGYKKIQINISINHRLQKNSDSSYNKYKSLNDLLSDINNPDLNSELISSVEIIIP